ncbi:glycosyltransferase [Muriicola sp. Z0-33]|uniref:glycosyltransferase n=1 Tax=Muriicola sp. Z0-33 TaxID=2816957 RepID=UPI00223742EE|nr:glycosyltransferase [Muriicola sp. Z0-33]MCW5516900.1 glycosyltransferase [Muriicola sp. Z0-33]
MKIDHVISTIDNASGGPSRSITHLVTKLAEFNKAVYQHIHCGETNDPIISEFSESNLSLSFYKRNLLGKLSGLGSNISIAPNTIFHGHGLWELPVHQMANMAQQNDIPYIISPHGMLNSWSFRQKSLKKKLALGIYQRRDIKLASCLHATAKMEARDLRQLGYTNPIAVIPNGIPMDKFPQKHYNQSHSKKTVLFLSRVVENKGVGELITAWSKLSRHITKDWNIKIVGDGRKEYINQLRKLIKSNGQEDTINLVGPLYGEEKIKAFQQASLFVLPTYSENFGMVVAEALACGIPVITTKGAPWEDLITNECGWWIDVGLEPLMKALELALSCSVNDLGKMGDNGRNLIEQKYSMRVVASQMNELYEWLSGAANRPEFLY